MSLGSQIEKTTLEEYYEGGKVELDNWDRALCTVVEARLCLYEQTLLWSDDTVLSELIHCDVETSVVI